MRSERSRKSGWALLCALLLLCTLPVLQTGLRAEEKRASRPAEYEVKAAFILNFIKFVEWPFPGGIPGGKVRVCLLGGLPDAGPFRELEGQTVRGRVLDVDELSENESAAGCAVLFLAGDQSRRLEQIIDRLAASPVLTIGDTDGYARRGVMINLLLENNRVRFEINASASRAAQIGISTKLLKLASRVHEPGTGFDR